MNIGKPTVYILAMAALLLVVAWLGSAVYQQKQRSFLPDRPETNRLSSGWDAALNRAENRATRFFSSKEDWSALAKLYLANGFAKQAEVAFERAIEESKGVDPKIRYYLGRIAQNEGRLEDSVDSFGELSYVPARRRLGESLRKLGRSKEALKVYEDLLEEAPSDVAALEGLSKGLISEGRELEALDLVSEARIRNPDSIRLGRLAIRLLEKFDRSEEAEAIRGFIRNRHDAPDADPWWEALSELCFDTQILSFAFEDRFKGAKIEEAFAFLKRIERLDAESGLADYLHGFANFEMKRFEEAIQHLERSRQKGFEAFRVLPLLASCYGEVARFSDAERTAREGLSGDNRSTLLWNSLGIAQFELGKKAAALESFQSVLENDAKNLKAMRYLARIFGERGDRSRSILYLEEIRREAKDDFISRAMLGQHFVESGDYLAALVPLREAAALKEGDESIQLILSQAYLELGNFALKENDFEKAGDFLREAVAAYPKNQAAQLGLARLRVSNNALEAACDGLEQALLANPESTKMYLFLGDIYGAREQFDQAFSAWSEALALAKRNGDTALIQGALARIESLKREGVQSP